IRDYERIAGDPSRVVELNPQECMCSAKDPKPVLERRVQEERERRLAPQPVRVPQPVAQPLPPQPAPSGGGIFDLGFWQKATGLSGLALVGYLVVSEGSRLFPPRNLVPVP